MATDDTIIWGKQRLKRETSRCVKCGICLAACPSYRVRQSETHSPRGRIALVEALVAGEVKADRAAHHQLSSCLSCGACEKACPSGVAFGALLDQGRGLIRKQTGWQRRLVQAALEEGLARRLRTPARWLSGGRLGKGRVPTAGRHNARGELRGRVGLFTGCAGPLLDGEALAAAVRLLTAADHEVVVPADQGCCGALAQHSGDPEKAGRMAERNRQAFADLDAVVGVSSGCGAHLKKVLPGYRDIAAFLVESGALSRLRFRPLKERVALHLPCTLENGLAGGGAVRRLLAAVPGLEVVEVGAERGCCGAGGLTFLEHPRQARRLAAPLAEEIRRAAPRWVVTANAGCGLHLRKQTPGLDYLHPVTLVAGQLEEKE